MTKNPHKKATGIVDGLGYHRVSLTKEALINIIAQAISAEQADIAHLHKQLMGMILTTPLDKIDGALMELLEKYL